MRLIVGVSGGDAPVVVMSGPCRLTKEEAIESACWLLILADIMDVTDPRLKEMFVKVSNS